MANGIAAFDTQDAHEAHTWNLAITPGFVTPASSSSTRFNLCEAGATYHIIAL
jgi:hypothetical protein